MGKTLKSPNMRTKYSTLTKAPVVRSDLFIDYALLVLALCETCVKPLVSLPNLLGRDRIDGWLGDSSGRPTVSRPTARAAMISGFRGARTILQQQRANITEFTVIIMCESIT